MQALPEVVVLILLGCWVFKSSKLFPSMIQALKILQTKQRDRPYMFGVGLMFFNSSSVCLICELCTSIVLNIDYSRYHAQLLRAGETSPYGFKRPLTHCFLTSCMW